MAFSKGGAQCSSHETLSDILKSEGGASALVPGWVAFLQRVKPKRLGLRLPCLRQDAAQFSTLVQSP